MKVFCLTFLLISGITDSRTDQYVVVGPSDPVFAFAGEDVILPCFVKPNISIVDMRVEWSRLDLNNTIVHLYEDHDDNNTGQIQSYRGRTELNHQELQRGNASLKLSSGKVSDEGRYKCLIDLKSWYDNVTVDVKVEAVGRPPVITVDGFDHSGGLHLQCESEGWFPEPDLEWLDSEGVRMSPETTETHRNADRFSVKQTLIVYQRGRYHCRVRLRHHMLEALIITTRNMFMSWKASVITITVSIVLTVIAGIVIAVLFHKNRELSSANRYLHIQKGPIQEVIPHLRKYKVNVTLNANSAHPRLIVSENGKQVKDGKPHLEEVNYEDEQQDRFTEYLAVLGKEGFSSGCFYYEVKVKGQNVWYLGVSSESVNKKEPIDLTPRNKYWAVGLKYGKYLFSESSCGSLTLSVNPQRVGVFVDYENRLISLYDVESSSHIYTYTDCYFYDKLYPFFCLGYKSNRNFTPLIICDDY